MNGTPEIGTRSPSSDESGESQRLPAPAGKLRVRLWALLFFLGSSGVLGIAAWLRPDPRGYGTHQQLGAGPCGMMVTTGLPCPTCGMTTAFAHTVRFQWMRAFQAQPAGLILAIVTGLMALGSFRTIVTGAWPAIRWERITPYRLFWLLLVVLIGGWGFKLASVVLRHDAPLGGHVTLGP